jgi:GntR family transcriptional regulator
VRPPERVARILELSQNDLALCVTRIRLANSHPIGLQTSYLVLPEGETITREELESAGSLYTVLKVKFNLIPTEANETVEATLASTEEANLLETAPGGPLLLTSRTMWSQGRRPIEYVKILYRGDRYQYTARLMV